MRSQIEVLYPDSKGHVSFIMPSYLLNIALVEQLATTTITLSLLSSNFKILLKGNVFLTYSAPFWIFLAKPPQRYYPRTPELKY